MTISISRITIIGLLFVFTLAFGVWLSNSGKPYQSVLFTIHKLVALGAVIVTTVTVYQVRARVDFNLFAVGALVITSVLFLALFVSGALLSIGRPDSAMILTIHRAAPLLAVIATAVTMALLVNSQS